MAKVDARYEIQYDVHTRPAVEELRGLQERRPLYLSVRGKFVVSTFAAIVWFSFSLWLAGPWIEDLSAVTGPFLAYPIIFLIALVPGFLNAHMLSSVLLDAPPRLPLEAMNARRAFPPVTVLIAAYNEQESLPSTLQGIASQDYPAPVKIVVADDGSTDQTVALLQALNLPGLKIVQARHGGKARALNRGLKAVDTDITVCIDADTFLHPQALRRIVARLVSDPAHTAGVAGTVLVRNSRASLLTRLQEWDYFLGIASAKRQQALYQGTLVAQGAFSAFYTDPLRRSFGWPPVIGEDIVLTWKLLFKGYRVGYEATAVAFTRAPEGLGGFARQRIRWARGMLEGLKQYGWRILRGRSLPAFFIGVDFVIPAIDLFYSAVFLPGVLLALTGRFYIVGPLTLLVIPLAFLIVLFMYRKQKRVFDELSLKVRRNSFGLLIFMIFYQALMSPICVAGYFKELAGARKQW